MKLLLKRKHFTPLSTIGELWVDGVFQCYTLEDRYREGPKVSGSTCIPYGSYKVIIDRSKRFKRLMPLLLAVPGFSGIRIHNGNTDKDTEGCILVGNTKKPDFVGESRAAFGILFLLLSTAFQAGLGINLKIEKEAQE